MKTGLRARRDGGCTRWVLLIGPYALKFPRFGYGWKLGLQGLLCNMQENEFGRAGWPELTPVVFSLPGGFLTVQRRCEPVPDDVWQAFDAAAFCERPDRHIPAEQKQDSFGFLNGRIVALDYGS